MPPDPDLLDLIEQAFLEGQIDGVMADTAYANLMTERGIDSRHAGAFCRTGFSSGRSLPQAAKSSRMGAFCYLAERESACIDSSDVQRGL